MTRPVTAPRRAGRILIAAAITLTGVAAVAFGVVVALNRRAADAITVMLAAIALIVTGAYLTARGARALMTGEPL